MSESDRLRWNEKYQAREALSHPPGEQSVEPSPFLQSLAPRLPATGAALDIAGGLGDEALWLARRGLDVTLLDLSDVALARAEARARALGLSLRTLQLDLERSPLPEGPFALLLCQSFLLRPLFSQLASRLVPGGLLVFAQKTARNLERHASPSRRFLLDEGELPTLVQGLEVLDYTEGWTDEGIHEARLVARRPPDAP